MGLRETINRRPSVAIAIGILVVLAASVVVYFQLRDPGRREFPKRYYYDTVTKELFPESRGREISFKRPNGNLAVSAIQFGCPNCDDESKRFTGYYQRYSPQTQAELDASPGAAQSPAYPQSKIIREVSKDGQAWVLETSLEGSKLMQVPCPNGNDLAMRCSTP